MPSPPQRERTKKARRAMAKRAVRTSPSRLTMPVSGSRPVYTAHLLYATLCFVGPSDVKEGEDKSAVEAEDEDDPSSLQLSWEMLELAKKCLKKKADSMPLDDEKRMEVEARLSQTYMHLGEVSIESENYPQAVEDLTSCLRRRQELLPDDSRCIAETHYQMGVALGFNLQFDEGVGHLEDAIAVLEKRIKNLEDKKESKGKQALMWCSFQAERSLTDSL
jgi:lipopolysaccharide biosynthesis regulator YciM